MTVPAIVLLLKEEELVELFRQSGAVSVNTAKSLSALSVSEDMTFRRMLDRAVLREGAPGMFYLDEAKYEERRNARRRLRPVLLVLVVVLAVVALVMTLRSGAGAL